LIAKALKVSNPVTWVYPLGRFELGGESSNYLLKAHLELMDIRRVHLNPKGIAKVADRIWCAIYLRELGYENFLSRIIRIIYPRQKNFSTESRKLSILGNFAYFLKSQRKNSGKYVVIGQILILFGKLVRTLQKRRGKFRERFILVLQKVLNIQPIVRPSDLDERVH
jgi:dsRNA-specific ribonuclease